MKETMETPLTFGGRKVIIAKPVLGTKEHIRTVKERLLGRPWNPFRKIDILKEYVEVLKDGEIVIHGGTFCMNERTWSKLQKETER